MKTYDTIIDLLKMEGPGLQDYVTTDELNQLIDGTLAPAVIADRYMADYDIAILTDVKTDDSETRADLLSWIRWETEIAVEQRKNAATDDAMVAKLNEISAMTAAEKRFTPRIHRDKLSVARQALTMRATKGAVANALGVSRPTLDAWLEEAD